MPDVKDVVNGLEMSYKYSNVDENNTLVPQWIVLHAIALLKAQEPRVMTWEEVKAWHKTGISEREPIFVEYRPEQSFGPSRWWLDNFGIAAVDDGAMVCYNKYLRCWTSRPTAEQREVTPWK
jgi:hypothetical protein